MRRFAGLLLATMLALTGCIPKKAQLKSLATQDGTYSIESYRFDKEAQMATLPVRSRNMQATGEIKPFGRPFRYDGENWVAVDPNEDHATSRRTVRRVAPKQWRPSASL